MVRMQSRLLVCRNECTACLLHYGVYVPSACTAIVCACLPAPHNGDVSTCTGSGLPACCTQEGRTGKPKLCVKDGEAGVIDHLIPRYRCYVNTTTCPDAVPCVNAIAPWAPCAETGAPASSDAYARGPFVACHESSRWLRHQTCAVERISSGQTHCTACVAQ